MVEDVGPFHKGDWLTFCLLLGESFLLWSVFNDDAVLLEGEILVLAIEGRGAAAVYVDKIVFLLGLNELFTFMGRMMYPGEVIESECLN